MVYCSKECFDIVFFVDWYNFVMNFVVWCVQGNCQCNVDYIVQFIQRWNYIGSGKCDVMFRQVKIEIIKYDFYCWNDVVQVEQRFVYVYYYYVSDWMLIGDFCCVDDFCCMLYLVDNF